VYGQEAEIVDLTRAFNEMLERLEGEQQDSVRRSLEAQESERQRVARELHDEVGQSLTAVMLQLDRVARFAPDGLREEMAEAREVARSSLEDVRAIAQRLRPEALDDLGLPSALTALTDGVSERTGIRIEKRLASPGPEMTPEEELVCYRIAQEAVTNALRHAEASAICIELKVADGAVTLTVVDDGTGLDGAAPGSGIQGMRERALIAGAKLQIESSGGIGTRVMLRLTDRGSEA
jgi:two-component system sensor histidine kinase UhpB